MVNVVYGDVVALEIRQRVKFDELGREQQFG